MMEIVEEYAQMKENENSGGGSGFFWDYISELDESEEEERSNDRKQ